MPVRALFPFLGGRTLEVEAIAARPADPIAAFSVGTGLLATGSGELTRLLKQVGLDIGGTAVLGYDIGLAGVKITPAGLLDALGIAVPTDISVAGLNQLLSANVSALDGVLDAVVRAASRDSLLDANVGLVQAIETAVGVKDLAVRLGSETAERAGGLFANIQAPDAASALNVELDALEVLATAIGVGTSGLVGQLTMTRAFGHGSALLTAALQYTTIIFAAFIGMGLWGDALDNLAWMGMGLIIFAGLLSVWRTMRRPGGA
ncbi:hypothetical protein OMF52_16850 [Bordetella pertussis]